MSCTIKPKPYSAISSLGLLIDTTLKKIGLYTNQNYLQLKSNQTERLLNKPYVNEVTLTGQNPLLKYCQPLELLTQLEKDIDLSMLKIWGL